MFAKTLLALLAAGSAVTAAPTTLAAREVISHDAVASIDERVPSGSTGTVYQKFKPLLKVVNGCVPFPAVDAAGNTGGGLKPTGGLSSDCDSSPGQMYVRGAWHANRYAIAYGWYMPKTEASTGIGHRHDWQSAVVWIDSPDKADPILLAVSTSNPDGSYATVVQDFKLDGDSRRPKIGYQSHWPKTHGLAPTDDVGGEQPLVAWEELPEAARKALSEADFGDAVFPFKDTNFDGNLAKAGGF